MAKKKKDLKFQGFNNKDSGLINRYIKSNNQNKQGSKKANREDGIRNPLELWETFLDTKNNAKTKPCINLEVYEQKIDEGRTALFEYLDEELFNITFIGCFHAYIEYNYKPGDKFYEAFYRYLRKALKNPSDLNREWAKNLSDGDVIKLYKEIVLPFVGYDKPFNPEFLK